MERHNPVGPGAVTEFDELFKIGYKALVSSLVTSAGELDDAKSRSRTSPRAHYVPRTLDRVAAGQLARAQSHVAAFGAGESRRQERLGAAGFIENLWRRSVHATVPQHGEHSRDPASKRRCVAEAAAGGSPCGSGHFKFLDDLDRASFARQTRSSICRWCWKQSSRTTPSIATTTARRRSPIAASCSTRCSISAACGWSMIAFLGI